MDFRFRFQRIDGVSHWLMLDRQASVNRAVLDWLTAD